jgi:hypothetical protein
LTVKENLRCGVLPGQIHAAPAEKFMVQNQHRPCRSVAQTEKDETRRSRGG